MHIILKHTFFKQYLYDCRVWSKATELVYERGVWVRCYGIPCYMYEISIFLLLLRPCTEDF